MFSTWSADLVRVVLPRGRRERMQKASTHTSRPNGLRAVVVSADRTVSGELTPLIAQKLPLVPVTQINSPPGRVSAGEVLNPPGVAICFVDVCSDSERALALVTDLAMLSPNLAIVALLPGDDSEPILRSLRQGASEFMIRPFTADQMQAIAEKLAKQNPELYPGRDGLGKVYAVIPAKGGCGATTIACSLASHHKRLGAKKALLADLDPLTGTVAFLLKLKSSYSFVDALAHASTLDADLWNVMICRHQGVDVLLSPENPADGMQEARDATIIVEYGRRLYDAVIADTSGPFTDFSLSVSRLADAVVIATTNELPALQAAQRAISHLESHGVSRSKIRLVLNRYSREIGLSEDAVQTALKIDVFHVIPSDYEAVQRSLMEGKPLAANSSIGKSLVALAENLGGKDDHPARASSLGGLFSLFSRS
jgi:pilus assembly protein CpaE